MVRPMSDKITVEMIGGPHDGGKTQVGRGCMAFAVQVIDDDGTVHFGAYKRDNATGKFRYELILVDPPSSGRTPPPLDDDTPWTPDRRFGDDS